jgi:UPF0755 protein
MEPTTPTPPRKILWKKVYLIVPGILLAGIFLFLFFVPSGNFPEGSIFTVENGASLRKTSRHLKEGGYIRSRIVFEALVILFGGEKHVISGNYLFEEKLSSWTVASRISEGRRGRAAVKVTIPEGFTNDEIATALDQKLFNFDEASFKTLAAGLQGYLFPDTYFFFNTETSAEIIRLMNENFKARMEDLADDLTASRRTEEEIIIMASLIEKEAKGEGDREYISGILWRRLEKGIALQADAAPETYDRRGLPDDPIANPGLLSIKAALYPKDSPYLYYLHDKEGIIHYAKTFDEHRANIEKYLK